MNQHTTFDENIPVRGFVDAQGNARVEPIGGPSKQDSSERHESQSSEHRESHSTDGREPVTTVQRDSRESHSVDGKEPVTREHHESSSSDGQGLRLREVAPSGRAEEYREPEQKQALPDEENWNRYSHEELYNSVHDKNHPGQVGEIGAEWERFREELTEAARQIGEGVTAAEAGWTGGAADGARAAMRRLADWVAQTAETVATMAGQVSEQARIMADARAGMPEPQNHSYDDATKSFSGGSIAGMAESAQDASAAREQAQDARREAIAVMKTMEQQSMALDRTTPAFAPPFNPVTGQVEDPAPLMNAQLAQGHHASGGYSGDGRGDVTSISGFHGGGGGGGRSTAIQSAAGRSAPDRFGGGRFGSGTKSSGEDDCADTASYGPGYGTGFERPDQKKRARGQHHLDPHAHKNKHKPRKKPEQRKQIKGDLDLKKPGDGRTAAAAARGGFGGGGGGFGGGGSSFGPSGVPTPPPLKAATGDSGTTTIGLVGGTRGGPPAGVAAGGGGRLGGDASPYMGGMPPMSPGMAGQQGQDLERKNKYAVSEQIVEVLGDELPPPVIGEAAQPQAAPPGTAQPKPVQHRRMDAS